MSLEETVVAALPWWGGRQHSSSGKLSSLLFVPQPRFISREATGASICWTQSRRAHSASGAPGNNAWGPLVKTAEGPCFVTGATWVLCAIVEGDVTMKPWPPMCIWFEEILEYGISTPSIKMMYICPQSDVIWHLWCMAAHRSQRCCSASLLCWGAKMSPSNLTSSDFRDSVRLATSSVITISHTTGISSSWSPLNLPYCYPTWPHRRGKPKRTAVWKVGGNNHCRIAFNQRLKWGWLEASPHAD